MKKDLEVENRDLRLQVWQLNETIGLLTAKVEECDRQIVQLREMVYIDHLTGVGNRRHFEEEMHKLQFSAEPFCLAMIDLDHLKAVNSDNGHAVGDKVLKKLAAILTAEQRGDDCIARIGGDEFIVLLRNCHRDGAQTYLHRLHKRIREGLTLQSRDSGRIMHFTASLGCAEHQVGEDENSLILRADLALRSAKNDGKDCVVIAMR